MYIIDFKKTWIKKEGKLSMCEVLKDAAAEEEISKLLEQYRNDITELISAKLSKLRDTYEIPEQEIKRIKDLVNELQEIEGMRCKD